VRKSGPKLRITAQLIEAESDRHLWSETYDRELDDIFAVQDEISAAIVEALSGILGIEGKVSKAPTATRTVNPEAYQAFLRGNAIGEQRTQPAKYEAIKEYERAIELDPNYAPAYAALAASWISLQKGDGSYGDLTLAEYEARAEALQKAIELNPNNAHAYSDLAIYYQTSGEADKITYPLEKAYELDPLNTRSAGNLALLKIFRGELDDAEAISKKLVLLNPVNGNTRLATVARERGNTDLTWDYAFKGLEADPTDNSVRNELSTRFAFSGYPEEAIEIFPQIEGQLYWYALETEKALAAAKAEYEADSKNFYAILGLGNAQSIAKNWEEAHRLYEQAYALVDGNFESVTDMEKAGWIDDNHLRQQAFALITLGEMDEALKRARAAADKGARIPEAFLKTLPSSDGWASLYDDPRLREIFKISDRVEAEQMTAIFTRLCTPPEEKFWQPSAETCASAKAKYGLTYTGKAK